MKKNFLLNTALVVLYMMMSLISDAQSAAKQTIRISDFHVVKNQNKIEINWSTNDKVAANYFEVERSNDGRTFKTVAYVLGADPTKKDGDYYGFSDRITTGSKTFYRLKHININGQVELSEVKSLALK